MAKKEKNDSLSFEGNDGPSVRPSFMHVLDEVREQIGWPLLFARSETVRPLAEEVAKIITEVYLLPDDSRIQIDGEWVDTGFVREIYRQITGDHVCRVIDNYRRARTVIKRPRQYLRTCLYNSVFEAALAEENEANVELADD